MLRYYDSGTIVFWIKHVQFNQDLYSSWPCFNRKTAVSWSLSREFITLYIEHISLQTVESDCLLAALSWTCFSYLKYCCNSIHFYWTGLALGLNRFLKCKQFLVPLLMTLYGDLFYCFCPTFVRVAKVGAIHNNLLTQWRPI